MANERGIPDIIGCWRGTFFGFEVKAEGRGATKIQQYHIDEIVKAGGFARVVNNVEAVRQMIK